MIKLNENENPDGPGPKAMAALRKEIAKVSRYPDMDGKALKQALAKHYNISPERITLSSGSGSASLLLLIVSQFTTRNDKIIFSGQGFINFFFNRNKRAGIFYRQCDIIPRNRYHHDLTAMANALTSQTRIIFIENPDNPTGTWIGNDELSAFLARIPEHVIVVMDEAYYEYARYAVGDDYPDTISLQRRHANLITLRTFSKAYGLAGLRVAYTVSSPGIIEILNKRRLKRSVTSPAIVAACAALKDEEHLKLILRNNETGMRYLENSFSEMNLDYIPSAANFITFNVGKKAQLVFEKLKQRNILISPLTGYDMPSNLRVTVGLHQENKIFAENLYDVLNETGNKGYDPYE